MLIGAIHKTIAANKFTACYIRPVIYLDGAMDLVVDSGKPRLIIAVWEWTAFLGAEAKERRKGVPFKRHPLADD